MSIVKKITTYGTFACASASSILTDSSVMKTFGTGGNISGYILGSFVALANFFLSVREYDDLQGVAQRQAAHQKKWLLELFAMLLIVSNSFSESLAAYTGLMASMPEIGVPGILVLSIVAAFQYLLLTGHCVLDYFEIESIFISYCQRHRALPARVKRLLTVLVQSAEYVILVTACFVIGYTGLVGMHHLWLTLLTMMLGASVLHIVNPVGWALAGACALISLMVSGFAFYETMLDRNEESPAGCVARFFKHRHQVTLKILSGINGMIEGFGIWLAMDSLPLQRIMSQSAKLGVCAAVAVATFIMLSIFAYGCIKKLSERCSPMCDDTPCAPTKHGLTGVLP
jgi:hypothetical protein